MDVKEWLGESRCDDERAPGTPYPLWAELLAQAERAIETGDLTAGLYPDTPRWLIGDLARELRYLAARVPELERELLALRAER